MFPLGNNLQAHWLLLWAGPNHKLLFKTTSLEGSKHKAERNLCSQLWLIAPFQSFFWAKQIIKESRDGGGTTKDWVTWSEALVATTRTLGAPHHPHPHISFPVEQTAAPKAVSGQEKWYRQEKWYSFRTGKIEPLCHTCPSELGPCSPGKHGTPGAHVIQSPHTGHEGLRIMWIRPNSAYESNSLSCLEGPKLKIDDFSFF